VQKIAIEMTIPDSVDLSDVLELAQELAKDLHEQAADPDDEPIDLDEVADLVSVGTIE
jgi:hypothetical protein